MKGKKCIKFLTFFITLVLSFVLFSNDTNAVDYTSNITFLGQKNVTSFNGFWRGSDTNTLTETLAQPLTIPKVILPDSSSVERYVDYFVSNGTLSVKKDNLYEVKIIMRVPDSTEMPLTVINSTANSATTDGVIWTIVNVKIDIWGDGTVAGGTTYTPTNSLVPLYRPTEIYPRQIAMYSILLKPSKDADNVHMAIGRAGQHMFLFPYMSVGSDMYQSNYELPRIQISPSNIINEYSLIDPSAEMNDKDDEDRSNIESQSSDTDTEANEQGDEASQTGTTLFGAFTQLLSALTNVNGNTCTLPAMQVYSLNLGNMNLCEYDIPPQIMALVSIGMVFIIIPLGINLVKRMVSLYKEITG